ncbi:hypothetical protein F5Y05DRAFT_276688, partial [Hypoxylon sp. FL0543]
MHIKSFFTIALLSALVAGTPTPEPLGSDVPITDAEWEALRSGGLKARSKVNVPISDADMKALEALRKSGTKRRGEGLETRDSNYVMNCGHKLSGSGGSGGNGIWVPVNQFYPLVDSFCMP